MKITSKKTIMTQSTQVMTQLFEDGENCDLVNTLKSVEDDLCKEQMMQILR